MSAQAFVFGTEFSPSGDVLGAPASRLVARSELEAEVARAQSEARLSAQAQGYAAVDRMLAQLAPVADKLSAAATLLRREAAELALAAARVIAGKALDADGEAAAAAAIASVLHMLKDKPGVAVCVSPDALAIVEQRMEQLARQGRAPPVTFASDPGARPGDWRIVWGEGAAAFSRAEAEAAVEAAIQSRLDDPVAPQLDLFAA